SLTLDEPDRLAAVISGPVILHQYLLADPISSTVTELALWSSAPPAIPYPTLSDTALLDALGAPLCSAYLGSCQ
ncbi:MAG: ATPase, partial [Mycobacterium sp.]